MIKSKGPPIGIIHDVFTKFEHPSGGLIWTNKGGEIQKSKAFCEALANPTSNNIHGRYISELTRADSLSQNGMTEIQNNVIF